MAVPSSGAMSMAQLYNEMALNNYASTKTSTNISLQELSRDPSAVDDINQCNSPHNRPDGSAPDAMSEFYGYDNDGEIQGIIADDWEDNDIGDGSRTSFHDLGFEMFEDGNLSESEINNSSTNDSPAGQSFTNRPAWIHSPTSPSLDTNRDVRLSNTNSPQGMWLKTVDTNFFTTTGIPFSGTLTSVNQQICMRYRFFMNSTNNKDGIVDIRMNTTNHPNAGVSTETYQVQIKDNSDPSPGQLRLARRNGTSVTTLATTPGAYTMGTTVDICVAVQEDSPGTRQFNIAVGPTTVATEDLVSGYEQISVADTNYDTLRGWTFRSPKAMSTPSSTHYHKYQFLYITTLQP